MGTIRHLVKRFIIIYSPVMCGTCMLWVICYSCCHFGSLWNSSCHIKRLIDVIRHMLSSQSCSFLTYTQLSCHTFLGMACCFSGLKFVFSFLFTLCTFGSLVLLVLACECICIRNLFSFLHGKLIHALTFLFSSKTLYALKDIGIISLGSLSSFFCHERKLLSIMSLPFM